MQRDEENGNLGCSIESVQVQIQNGTSTQILQENTTGCVEILILFEGVVGAGTGGIPLVVCSNRKRKKTRLLWLF